MSPLQQCLLDLDNIAACGPSTGKKQLLSEVSLLTRQIIVAALDPYKMYGIKKFPTSVQQMATCSDDDGTELFRTLDALQKREVTGKKALDEISFLLGRYLVPAELLSRIVNKDLRCGVGAALVNDVFPRLIPEFKVALAQEYEGEDQEFPLYESIKYDGLRCLAIVNSSGVTLKTRNGLEITSAEHIKPWLEQAWLLADGLNGLVFDGELMKLEGHFQDSSGAIRRKSEQSADLVYKTFDILTEDEFLNQRTTQSQSGRLEYLKFVLSTQLPESPVHYVEHNLIRNHSEAVALSKKRIADGEEGSIYKDPNVPYQFKRSSAWLKVKDRKTADVRVKGLVEGKGKHKGKMGAIVVEFQGSDNKVGTGFSDSQREMFWNNPNIILQKMVEISYHEVTKAGNMRHSRFEKERGDLE